MKNPSVAGKSCAICGRPAQSFAHIVHRGMGGDPNGERTDGYPACGVDHSDARTCHGAQGQSLLTVERHDDGTLWYCPSERYAATLRRRGVRCKAGLLSVALYADFDPDAVDERPEAPDDDPAVDEPQEPDTALGDSLHILATRIGAECVGSGEGWRITAEANYTAEALLVAAHGPKAGKAAAREWREQLTTADGVPIPIGKAEASKMAAVVKYIPATLGRSLPSTRQYAASVAVKRGKRTAEESVTLAEALSLSAFRAEVYGESEPAEPTLYECGACGFRGTKDAILVEVS